MVCLEQITTAHVFYSFKDSILQAFDSHHGSSRTSSATKSTWTTTKQVQTRAAGGTRVKKYNNTNRPSMQAGRSSQSAVRVGRNQERRRKSPNMSRAEYSFAWTRSSRAPKFFVFDCVTSGDDARRGRILELAIVEYIPGQKIDDIAPHSILVNPRRELTKTNVKKHGITDGMLQDERLFPDAWKEFVAFVESACEEGDRPVLVAHKARFNVNFLSEEMRRNEMKVPKWDVACSLAIAKDVWPGEAVGLGKLALRFSVNGCGVKRAGGGVKGLCKVLDGMNDIASRSGESIELLLLLELFPFQHSGGLHESLTQSPPSSDVRLRSVSSSTSSETKYRTRRPEAVSADIGTVSTRTTPRSFPEEDVSQQQSSQTSSPPISQSRDVSEALSRPGADAPTRSESQRSEDDMRRRGLVYMTAKGHCYHTMETCNGLKKKKYDLSICPKSEATKNKLKACKVCCSASPKSVMSTAVDFENANYYCTPTGERYHLDFQCEGLSTAKAKIPCDTIPPGLTLCLKCASSGRH